MIFLGSRASCRCRAQSRSKSTGAKDYMLDRIVVEHAALNEMILIWTKVPDDCTFVLAAETKAVDPPMQVRISLPSASPLPPPAGPLTLSRSLAERGSGW